MIWGYPHDLGNLYIYVYIYIHIMIATIVTENRDSTSYGRFKFGKLI